MLFLRFGVYHDSKTSNYNPICSGDVFNYDNKCRFILTEQTLKGERSARLSNLEYNFYIWTIEDLQWEIDHEILYQISNTNLFTESNFALKGKWTNGEISTSLVNIFAISFLLSKIRLFKIDIS